MSDDRPVDIQPRSKGGGIRRQKQQAHRSLPPNAAAVDLPLPDGGIQIDGSLLEGGGQILRNASALSAILQQPIKVDKIRAGRDKPGLRPQHLTGLQLVAELSGGSLQGGQVGSCSITLQPGRLVCGSHLADTRTAGSCMLLAQSALPCLLYAAPASDPGRQHEQAADGGSSTGGSMPPATSAAPQPAPAAAVAPQAAPPAVACSSEVLQAALQTGTASQLDLRGGTDAAMAPPAGYMQHVLLPILHRKLHIQADVQLLRRGFFPKGQGRVLLTAAALPPGSCLPAVDLTQRGDITGITIRAFTAGRLVPTIGERLAAAAHKVIKSRMPRAGVPRDLPINIDVVQEPPERAFGDGCGILVTATSSTGCVFGATGLGERGVPAETIGQRAADELMDVLESGACTDEWLQDQLIIFMALAQGRSRLLTSEPTLHTRTACMVAEALTGARFRIAKETGGQEGASSALWVVECEGAGVAAPCS